RGQLPAPRAARGHGEPGLEGGQEEPRRRVDRLNEGEVGDEDPLFRAPQTRLSDIRIVRLENQYDEQSQSDYPTIRRSDAAHKVSGGSSTPSTGGPAGFVSAHARQMSASAPRPSAG